jgi:hypothetical protein
MRITKRHNKIIKTVIKFSVFIWNGICDKAFHSVRSPYALSLHSFSVIMGSIIGLIFLMTWIIETNRTLPGPKVNLPKFNSISAASVALKSQDKIVVTITRKPEFFLDNRPVLTECLHSELWKLMKHRRNPVIYLKADNA